MLQTVEARETVRGVLLPILLCKVNNTALSIIPTTGTDMALPMPCFNSRSVKLLGIIEGEKP